MNKQRITSIITVSICILAFIYILKIEPSSTYPNQAFITSVTYHCDHNKQITASYFSGPQRPVRLGHIPQPTGSVHVSFDEHPPQKLNQTISANGVRYANTDESLVFWNKGNTALIMRNNSMDLTYTHCLATE